MMSQPVRVERAFTVNAPRERVWAFLRDPACLSACIPGVSDVKALKDSAFQAIVEVTILTLTARFDLDVRIAEETPPSCMVAEMSGKDEKTGSLLETRNRVELKAMEGDQTEVVFCIDARLSGKLAALGGGMAVKIKSRQMAREFAKEVKCRIESEGQD
jgi:carbon monoxide dehydrogenase subunit G